jgi:hypothetical protein
MGVELLAVWGAPGETFLFATNASAGAVEPGRFVRNLCISKPLNKEGANKQTKKNKTGTENE